MQRLPITFVCYQEKLTLTQGSLAVWGAAPIFVELINHVPLALRALKSWELLAIVGGGGPIPWAGVMVLRFWLRDTSRDISVGVCVCVWSLLAAAYGIPIGTSSRRVM